MSANFNEKDVGNLLLKRKENNPSPQSAQPADKPAESTSDDKDGGGGKKDKPRRRKEADGDTQIGDEGNTSPSFFEKILEGLLNFIKQVLTFPLRNEPISFYRDSEFDAKGKYIGNEDDEAKSDALESYINYDPVSKQRFEMVLHRRKNDLENLDRLNVEPVDMSKFPLWNEETINYLRTTFTTFDVTQDGLLSLENWNDMLYEMGDQSSEEERESQFYLVSDGDSFIDFPQFLDLLYTITMKDHKAPQTILLATGIRTANYNISRMKNLDLVQRMQVGMF